MSTSIALGIVSTTFVNLAIGLTIERENRQLKRIRGTPLPIPAFIAGRVATAFALAAALTVVLLAVGRVAYGVSLPGSTAPGVVLSLFVGAAAFCCLGFAFSTVIPNEDAAPPVVNAVVLPLYFVSGLFFPTDDAPAWLTTLAEAFPIKHLAEALFEAFDRWRQARASRGVTWGYSRPGASPASSSRPRRFAGPRRASDRRVALNHVALTVADRERSAAFYGEHFGLVAASTMTTSCSS